MIQKEQDNKKESKESTVGKIKSSMRRRERGGDEDFGQKILDLSRVARVTSGGKRMRFRACVIIGDKKGKIGLGLAKGSDVADALNKSVAKAKKNMLDLTHYHGVIPHRFEVKYRAAKVFIKPGRAGDGIIAGGVVRNILEMAGFKDVVAKILGSNSKINNSRATFELLNSFLDYKKPIKK
ncbi:MAG: small subunit ribosomal protein S5 [Parcubacteria group bacterium Gr01-1014_18]|nr:MAG: small subunit ribosomal protein S5 [Parcubacteria group bacterium Greene0416_36]TSC80268.1 MAG: small subunit ribosomal protein S5 [Parcubacteria group bacterium Gr01-1014_18]TSC98247.1 MAG: small subunit ribosomal protein S5 [Parcubacteria group bacterium Greene1014_20]TSD07010.1 MAG: small subunit ribosomal protein S5 [Parcubacteria group bacterium Greene0714_2]